MGYDADALLFERQQRRVNRGVQRRATEEQPLQAVAAPFLSLPGLRGFWSLGAFDESGNAFDMSGNARTLTYNGNPTYTHTATAGTVPNLILDGTGDYLSRADEAGLDITGTEAYVVSTRRGLTLGGWFRFANAAGSSEGMLTKDNEGAQRSYRLSRATTGAVRFSVSSDGTSSYTTASSTAVPAVDTWTFVAGRFVPSTSVDVWANAEKTSTTTSVPASVFSGSANLLIGGFSGGGNLLTGRVSLCFLCATALQDATIAQLYQRTRGAFGV
jgi:hypothetical protein